MNYPSLQNIKIATALAATLMIILPANAQEDVNRGAEVYEETCIACHGENGKGEIPGVPDFTSSKSPLAKEDIVLLDHIINGFQGPTSDLEMPALGSNEDLTEQNIKDVIVYMRAKFKSGK
jgi:cytochrome c5